VLWATRYLLWGFIQGERLLPVTAAKQAAEKLQLWGFVTGNDFSRADKAHRINWALTAANDRWTNMLGNQPLFRSL
jgi:hypothetical protein